MNLKSIFLVLSLLISPPLFADGLGQLNPEQLQSLQQSQNALIVDVRTPAEWQASGVIANSQKLQGFDSNGQFDADKWLSDLQKLKSSAEQPVILVCRSGNRSSKIGEILAQRGEKNIYHLSNGIQGWMQSGLPVKAE
ncbi:MAG: rhodanese-like domain-containing protein [Methylomonas sp.]